MRRGIRLGVDWGATRIGVAACDPAGVLAYPVRTIPAGPDAIAQLAATVAEYEPIEVILGLPLTLRAEESFAASAVRAVAAEIDAAVGVPVRLVDERLTTRTASVLLRKAGRTARRQRSIIDQAAAVALLEQAMEYERTTGRPAGEVVNHQDREAKGRPG